MMSQNGMSDGKDFIEPAFRPGGHKIILLTGILGAGKTTWRTQFLSEHSGEPWSCISADDLRLRYAVRYGISYNEAHVGTHGAEVSRLFEQTLRQAVLRGSNIIIDTVNADSERRCRQLSRIQGMAKETHPETSGEYYDQTAIMTFLATEDEVAARHAKADAEARARGGLAKDVPKDVIARMNRLLLEGLPGTVPCERVDHVHYIVSPGFETAFPGISRQLAERAGPQRGGWTRKAS